MTKERKEEMMVKVRKLLVLARHAGGNENEKNVAMEQANKIMIAYGIAEAECDMAELDRGELEFGTGLCDSKGKEPKKGNVSRNIPTWLSILSLGVARFTDTISAITYTEYGKVLIYKGEIQDVQFACWLLGTLVDAIYREQKLSGWTKRGDSVPFRNGASSSLARRLRLLAEERRAAYQQAQADSGCRAIMVVDRKRNEVEKRFGVQTSQTTRTPRSAAYMSGRIAGHGINIPQGRPIGGGNSNRGQIGQ